MKTIALGLLLVAYNILLDLSAYLFQALFSEVKLKIIIGFIPEYMNTLNCILTLPSNDLF